MHGPFRKILGPGPRPPGSTILFAAHIVVDAISSFFGFFCDIYCTSPFNIIFACILCTTLCTLFLLLAVNKSFYLLC